MAIQISNGMYDQHTNEVIYNVGMPGVPVPPPIPPIPPMPPYPGPPVPPGYPIPIQGTQGTQGTRGIQGSMGLHGHVGAQGAQGPAGQNGIDGKDGKDGKDGVQGIQGPIGLHGHVGAQGAQGISGKDGINGKDGAQGIQGVQGIQGPIGLHGHVGAQGAQGKVGTGLEIKGAVNSIYNLPGTATEGDVWMVGAELYTYMGVGKGSPDTPQSAWISFSLQGVQGIQGPKGDAGDANLNENTFKLNEFGRYDYVGLTLHINVEDIVKIGDVYTTTINHNLNCRPDILVFTEYDGEEVLIELEVTYIDNNTIKLEWNSLEVDNLKVVLR
jgi:hypothetical protein